MCCSRLMLGRLPFAPATWLTVEAYALRFAGRPIPVFARHPSPTVAAVTRVDADSREMRV
jgi:hypothetical protein